MVSAAKIRASLRSQISPRCTSARIRALLKKRGYRLKFKALTAGKALIRWYYLPKGAQLAKAKKKRDPARITPCAACANASFNSSSAWPPPSASTTRPADPAAPSSTTAPNRAESTI